MHVTLNSEINCKPCFRLKTLKTAPCPPAEKKTNVKRNCQASSVRLKSLTDKRQSLANYAAGSCGRDWSNIYVTCSIPATFGAQNINIYK